jgi:VTC domain
LNEKIENIIHKFSPISIKEVEQIKMPDRIDTKFVFSSHKLEKILAQVIHEYKILDIENQRKQTYSTYYFDTPVKSFYHHHHQGKGNRYKIRVRHYHYTNDEFFELKTKNNKAVTRKKRIELNGSFNPTVDLPACLKKVGLDENMPLEFSISNKFTRISLASPENTERVTIDFNLSFKKEDKEISLPYLIICEVKTNKKYSKSILYKLLKSEHIQPTRISKYVVGNILLDEKIKMNRFKKKMLILKKIENEYNAT